MTDTYNVLSAKPYIVAAAIVHNLCSHQEQVPSGVLPLQRDVPSQT